jgi:hypothetical protein
MNARLSDSWYYQLLRFRINAYLESRPVLPLKIHHSVNQGEERIIRPFTDILAGMEFGAPLPDQYIPCTDELTAESFNAEAL